MIQEVHRLEVMYRGRPVGILQMDPSGGVCVFEYHREWLASGFSISPTELPLQSGLFLGRKDFFDGSFAVFEDSLPDGYGLFLLDRMLRKEGLSLRGLSPLQRLSIIGNSGMGALSYMPVMPGFDHQSETENELELDILQEEALKLFSEKESGDASLLYYNSANSGGARPKTAFRTKDGAHWLVKFRHTYDPQEIGKTELRYMTAARECGISIPKVGLLRDRYFCIERFDIDSSGQRLHMLSAAALLKTDFRNHDADYTNLLALTGYLTQDPRQVEEMFRRMVFNLVAVNKDDHAKNFSFICRDSKWELAPAYDLTYSPEGTNGQHATSLFYDGNPGLDLVLKAGTGIRIPHERCMEIVNTVQSVCENRLGHIEKLK